MGFLDSNDRLRALERKVRALCGEFCCKVKGCLLNMADGDGNYVIHIDGDEVTLSPGSGGAFSCSDLLACSTDSLPEGSTNLYFSCDKVENCLGISLGGNPGLFLNEQGNFVAASGGLPTGTPTQITYFDPSTGILTSDIDFFRDPISQTIIRNSDGGGNSSVLQNSSGAFSVSATDSISIGSISISNVSVSLDFNNSGGLHSGMTFGNSVLAIVNNNGVATKSWLWPTEWGTANSILTDVAGDGTLTFNSIDTLAWSLLGNAGTDSTINFIGTTDGEALVFRAGGAFSGIVGDSAGNNNTSFGYNSLNVDGGGVGTHNVAFGTSLFTSSLVTGGQNTAIGELSFAGLEGGVGNISVGVSNLNSLTDGSGNTAVGVAVLQNVTIGSHNNAIGNAAGATIITGDNNTFIGQGADASADVSGSTAIGLGAIIAISDAIKLGAIATNVGIGNTDSPTSTLTVKGGQNVNVTLIGNSDSPYAILITDYIVPVDSTSGTVVLTLRSSPAIGETYIIKDVNGNALVNNITVDGNGNDIDGLSTQIINLNYKSLTLTFTGAQWSII